MQIVTTSLPSGLVHYHSTSIFTEQTVPEGLLSDHATKPGVWGLIKVRRGTLRFHVTDPRRRPTTVELSAATNPGIVEPTIRHRVEPVGTVEFVVLFYRAL